MRRNRILAAGSTVVVTLALMIVALPRLVRGEDSRAAEIFVRKLPNVPGKTLTAIVVDYAPGGKSPSHSHSGSVFAYVLSGAVRSGVSSNGSPRVYQAGESFFEPPNSQHSISENASQTQPARILAVFVADDGAQLSTIQK
jgi:quercetin dioxygenase-like cupin family protein